MKRTYKIETRGSVITLYRRRLRFLWFPVESRSFCYSQHRIKITWEWLEKYGKDNFISDKCYWTITRVINFYLSLHQCTWERAMKIFWISLVAVFTEIAKIQGNNRHKLIGHARGLVSYFGCWAFGDAWWTGECTKSLFYYGRKSKKVFYKYFQAGRDQHHRERREKFSSAFRHVFQGALIDFLGDARERLSRGTRRRVPFLFAC